MTQNEFTTMTGRIVTAMDWDAIEALYLASDLSSEAFCNAFAKVPLHSDLYFMLLNAGSELYTLRDLANEQEVDYYIEDCIDCYK